MFNKLKQFYTTIAIGAMFPEIPEPEQPINPPFEDMFGNNSSSSIYNMRA